MPYNRDPLKYILTLHRHFFVISVTKGKQMYLSDLRPLYYLLLNFLNFFISAKRVTVVLLVRVLLHVRSSTSILSLWRTLGETYIQG